MQQMAHPLFGGSFGDQARRGQGVGLAPLSEGYTALVPNPGWPGMVPVQQIAFGSGVLQANPGPLPFPGLQSVQTTAFPGGAIAPGESAVRQRAFGRDPNPVKKEDMVYAQLPDGRRVRSFKHRLYRTPRTGHLTGMDVVAVNPSASVKKAWLHASWNGQKPNGVRGKWVQLSTGDSSIGLMHTPGNKPQPVTVLQVGNAMTGPKALVRYQKNAPNRNPRGSKVTRKSTTTRTRSGGGRVVSTRSRPAGMKAARIQQGSATAGGLFCKIFKNAPRCTADKVAVCGPGMENYPADPRK